jgi:NTE family protein
VFLEVPMTRPRIGLALGSGSARGWAHIGVLRALIEAGTAPDIVCGTSIGALVGGAYVSGRLDALDDWARSISLFDIVGLMDVTLARGGVISGTRLFKGLRSLQPDQLIEDLPKPFAAVATDFASGRELWLQKGSLLDAVRASASLPGIFPPVKMGGEWLVDGGLVNPVPVSVCRALGAEVVIAVNLNGDVTSRNVSQRFARRRQRVARVREPDLLNKLSVRLREEFRGTASFLSSQLLRPKQKGPGFFEVLAGTIYIMQDRITRSRMAGDPPDVMIAPQLGHVRLLDFHRAEEAIDEGYACVAPMLSVIERAVATGSGVDA